MDLVEREPVIKFWPREPFLIGMVHLPPLPGSARFSGAVETCFAVAHQDGQTYAARGMDALLVENHGDAPFAASRVDPPRSNLVFLGRLREGCNAGEVFD